MTFRLNPGPLHWREWGDATQPRIVFLHGFMGSSQDWEPVIANLAQDYHCLAVDLPGHGNSLGLAADQYTMASTAQQLRQDLAQSSAPEEQLADLIVGYSMGGRVALYLSLSFPQSFPQAQIISGSPGLASRQEREARRALDLIRCCQIRDNLNIFLSLWYQQPLFASLWKTSAPEVLIQQRLRNNPDELCLSLKHLGLGAQPNLWAKLPRSSAKLHGLVGELDSKFIAIAQEMAHRNPSLDWKILPGVGHNIPLEDPSAIAAEIRRVLPAPA